MGAPNEIKAILVIAWLFAFMLVIASLFRPVPPFRSRLQALFLGLPALVFGPFIIAMMLGWAPEPRNPARAQTPASPAPEVAPQPSPAAVAQNGDTGSSATEAQTAVPAEVQVAAQVLKVVALTHINRATGKRITYREPRTTVLVKQDVPEGAWTVAEGSLQVLCFADGNNAVFFTMGDRFFAANGKARQFVRHRDGDGIVLENDVVVPVEELERGKHVKLISAVIDAGLDLCAQKSIDEINDAARNASGPSPSATPPTPPLSDEALFNAALAIRGADICGYDFNAAAMVDYLEQHNIDQQRFTAEVEPYLVIANGILSGTRDKTFCRKDFLPKFGPDGLGIVSK
ncbi:hypothetical protein [Aminobacter aminovorans]|uniref:Uncharacterized protein n=1 Tax=Aminobacter aminovorans TaxID=83263 RepID=A0AAC8YKT9_AMIAI|nr:hypothetical protein [Aminobacter aminovorans]AMS40147.1 hypothetical protein AA2016_1212 [Aminobacter aminovorans]MBB3709874.1 hypothetical protein [Aminobacter aminovorans]